MWMMFMLREMECTFQHKNNIHKILWLHTNSCNTKWTIDFPIANNLKQCKYLDACVNLYKFHGTWIFIGTTKQNLVFFSSIIGFIFYVKMVHENSTNIEMFYPLGVAILCHQKLRVPNGRSNLNPIPQLFTP